jgi:stearoyl-CoA desaturase (delta-9 desaturase)
MAERCDRAADAVEPACASRMPRSPSAPASGGRGLERIPVGVTIGGLPAVTKRIENAVLIGVPLAGTLYFPVHAARHGVGWIEVCSFLIGYAVIGIGIGIGFHRHFSHRSFETVGSVLRVALGVAGSMAFQGSVLRWVTDHRRHHAHTDLAGDVHSPYADASGEPCGGIAGLLHAHIGWMFDAATTSYDVYAADLREDRLIMFLHRTRWVWPVLSLLLPWLAGFWLGGAEVALGCLLLGGCVRTTLFHNVVWAVNSIGHAYGEEPFPQRNKSRNNAALAFLTFGEGWHNNHHRYPRSAFHGLARRELDVNGLIIRGLERAGLVRRVIRVAGREARVGAG